MRTFSFLQLLFSQNLFIKRMVMERARTFGELKATGYRSIPVKDELRANLIRKKVRSKAGF